MSQDSLPEIKWIKNDKEKYRYHFDGSRYLVALQVSVKGAPLEWDFFQIRVDADGEYLCFLNEDCGCSFDSWQWEDFDYFHLIEGEMPTDKMDDQ